jgi:xanthine/uracil permease
MIPPSFWFADIISAALIVSGLASMVQVLRFRIPFTPYFLGKQHHL